MREDYIAELDPYARLLPNRIRARYRMQYMGQAAALEAVTKPAELGGRPFEPGVAENLVNNLREMSDVEAEEPKLGENVEPVQLQVVCMQLWDNLSNRIGATITAEDLESLARGAGLSEFVNHALASFYEQTLTAVLTVTGALTSERELRDWFSSKLITRDGTRNLLYQSDAETGGMANAVVLELERRFLLRGETRGGGRWIELVHDRLVEPILDANEAWRRTLPLVMAADLWNLNRSASLLLTGDALAEAQAELAAHPTRYGPVERLFVETSAEVEATRRAAAEAEEKRRRQEAARDRIITIGASVMALIMLLLLLTSLWLAQQAFIQSQQQRIAAERARAAEQRANEQAQIAKERADEANRERIRAETAQALTEQLNRQIRADQLASQAVLALPNSPQQALLLAVESISMTNASDTSLSHTVEQSIHDILLATGGSPVATGASAPVALVLSPDVRWYALSTEDGAVSLWRTDNLSTVAIELAAPGGALATALTAAPDGSQLAAAQEDGVVRVWQINAEAPLSTDYVTDGAMLTTVAFSPDGSLLAAGDDLGIVYLWRTGQPELAPQQLAAHSGGIAALAFSPDGTWLASGGDDGAVLRWPLDQPDAPLTVASHGAGVSTLVFSLDGSRLASGDATGGVQLFTASPDGGASVQLPGNTAAVTAMSFSNNGVWLASGDANGVMRVANLVDATRSYVTPAYDSRLNGLAFVRSARGDRLVTIGSDIADAASVRLWDYANFGLAPTTVRGHDDAITLLATAPGVNGFLTAGYDRGLRIWPVDSPFADPKILATEATHFDKMAGPSASARLYSIGAAFPSVQVWNAITGQAGAALSTGREDGLTALAVNADGSLIAAGDTAGFVHVWASADQTPFVSFAAHTGAVRSLALQPDARLLATGGDDGNVYLWNLDDPATVQTLAAEGVPVGAMQFSPGGDQLAFTNADNGVTIVALDEAGASADDLDLPTQSGGLTTVAFSPDGSLLAAGGVDGHVWLWHLSQPARPPQLWEAHPNEINVLVFGADRNQLLTASADYSVRLWNPTAVVKTPVILRGHQASVNSIVYAEETLFTISTDRTLRRWLLASDALALQACAVAGRNLDQEEWNRYFPETPCRATCPAFPDRCAQPAP